MARPKPGHAPIITVEDSLASAAVRRQQADTPEAYRTPLAVGRASGVPVPSEAAAGSKPAVLPEQEPQRTDQLHP